MKSEWGRALHELETRVGPLNRKKKIFSAAITSKIKPVPPSSLFLEKFKSTGHRTVRSYRYHQFDGNLEWFH